MVISKIAILLFAILIFPSISFGAVAWDQVLDTQAEHEGCFTETNNPHFTQTWVSSGGWNGTEGYMRWTIAYTEDEDDDGYIFDHPNTAAGPVYLSFIARWGSTWTNHLLGRWKFVMFYNTTEGNPRPVGCWDNVENGLGRYGIFSADIAAGGNCIDEFGQGTPEPNYPDHLYKQWEGTGADQWYFHVFALVGSYIYVWIYSQDGTLTGGAHGNPYYVRSQEDATFGNYTWSYSRLLAYPQPGTTAGDANSYIDISHIMLSQSMPSVPDGFLIGGSSTPKVQGITASKINGVTPYRVNGAR